MAIFLNQSSTTSPYLTAVLYTISFDPSTGLATLDFTGGQNVGFNARSMTISPTGNYLAIGFEEVNGFITVYQLG
jgi:hypothetical protein